MTPGQRPIAILLDLLAFAAGLGMAWAFGWQARDLVWGLWLSSLVVGYTTIVVGIGRGVFHGSRSLRTPGDLLGFAISLVLGGFLLTFFTIHFGGFHFVHSVFLNLFFPIVDATDIPSEGLYTEVFRRYWPFVSPGIVLIRWIMLGPVPNDQYRNFGIFPEMRKDFQSVHRFMFPSPCRST